MRSSITQSYEIDATTTNNDENDKSIEGEPCEMEIDRKTATKPNGEEGNMILEAHKYKMDDTRLLNAVNEIINLIDFIRLKSKTNDKNQVEINYLLNSIIDELNLNEDNTDENVVQIVINRLKNLKNMF